VSDNDKQDPPVVVLDEHRGMAAQKATDERRHSSEVQADQEALRQNREELEAVLFAVTAQTWPESAERAAYLLRLFAGTPEARDPRYQQMIASVLDDFVRLRGDAADT
jgi:phage terminase Nu1 subunit (DNA packaging protein)